MLSTPGIAETLSFPKPSVECQFIDRIFVLALSAARSDVVQIAFLASGVKPSLCSDFLRVGFYY